MSGRLVYGRHPVEALFASRPGDLQRVYAGEGADPKFLARLEKAGVTVERLTRDRLEALAKTPHHQGLVAEAADFRFVGLEALVPASGAALVLALDSVQDPQNLGALARSAECFGATGLLVPQDRAAQVTGAALKASAGALERVPVARVVNLVRALESLKEQGMWVTGLAGEGGDLLTAVDLTGHTVLVVGAEGDGLRPLVRRTCDRLARIPIVGATGSLNASVAGGVALFEAHRQRISAGSGVVSKSA